MSKSWKDELFKYITGITTNKKQKLICVNGVEDHIHILLGISPTVLLSDVIRDIKANASRFINEKNLTKGRFEWQPGFGAFSCGHTQLDMVYKYVMNQEEHHRKRDFKEEYIAFLEENGIDYDLKYAFDED